MIKAQKMDWRIISKMVLLFILILLGCTTIKAQNQPFKVLAFYTGNDQAHISFVKEANEWFPKMGKIHNFTYEATNNWENLNTAYIKNYDALIFLDTRPETPAQRESFEEYMKNGGGWLGFHFSAFSLANSSFPNNWDWYHNIF